MILDQMCVYAYIYTHTYMYVYCRANICNHHRFLFTVLPRLQHKQETQTAKCCHWIKETRDQSTGELMQLDFVYTKEEELQGKELQKWNSSPLEAILKGPKRWDTTWRKPCEENSRHPSQKLAAQALDLQKKPFWRLPALPSENYL